MLMKPQPLQEENSYQDSFAEGQPQSEESQSRRKQSKAKNKKKDKRDDKKDNVFLYKPGVELPNLTGYQVIRVYISSQYISKSNPEVHQRSIWGNQSYTSNSDLVCVLIHAGLIDLNSANVHKYDGYQLVCKVTKPRKSYAANLKNGILSRSSKGYNGNALKPQELIPIPTGTVLRNQDFLLQCAKRMHIPQKSRTKAKPISLPLVPIPQTHIIFNRNNQPAYKYSLFNIADHFQRSKQLIKRLDKQVIYLQSKQGFYELYKQPYKTYFDRFRFSFVKDENKISNEYFAKASAPLPLDQLEVLQNGLEWEDIKWGASRIKVRELEVNNLLSFKFYKILTRN